MALISTVSLGMSFSATRFMVKPAASLTLVKPPSTKSIHTTSIRCTSNDTALVSRGDACVDDKSIVRRSGNYPPPIWDDDFVQSLDSDFKERVRMLLNKEDMDNLKKLELVDSVQRLGVGYHFKNEITRILEAVYSTEKWDGQDNLHATSLKFRLLRQHKFRVPEKAFSGFLNELGKFKISPTSDMKGMLYLYEASYHSKTNEKILDEAQRFTTKHMTDYINNSKNSKDDKLSELVSRALELPLHWTETRHEARWYIDYFETSVLAQDINYSHLLRFAKLDYNMLQAIYQDELKESSRWWKSIQWAEKLSFARPRLIECFYWSVGYNFEPEFQYARSVLTAVNAFITTIDDIYDVYGTLEELELLTKLTKSWDAAELDQLPDFMKICFTDFYNKINEVANVFQREHGVSVLPYFQKWTDLFDAYLVEAKWYHSGYKPSLSEYLDRAWLSISGAVLLTHLYFVKPNSLKHEDLQCLMTYPNILRHSATILRLADDMGTSSHEMERGDNPKSIQCYMNDKGVSEDKAKEHIKYLLTETWKKLNEECAESPLSKPFIENCLNLARIASCVYLYGDGHGAPSSRDKERLLFLFVHPIPL
ncbi:hypothetical protein DCAR_0417753 [Daucus carota subsp. sativus]|uniref:Uncharacterized protein n=1 Tax=Daucus carota subsp. sativus TaxID=79200 RepID=A0AAF0X0E6_DAUCS|nr:hypothetical protein DCAR_0417753 [Daucus carota subsp. sativus]